MYDIYLHHPELVLSQAPVVTGVARIPATHVRVMPWPQDFFDHLSTSHLPHYFWIDTKQPDPPPANVSWSTRHGNTNPTRRCGPRAG